MAIRNLLHMDKLEDFEEYLKNDEGYMILPLSNNPYEVLRAKKGSDTVIIYRRSSAKEHLSVMEKDYRLVERFLHGVRADPDPGNVFDGSDSDTELPWK